jgi:ankyrin repeat protein
MLIAKDWEAQVLKEKIANMKITYKNETEQLQFSIINKKEKSLTKQRLFDEELLTAATQGDLRKLYSAVALGAAMTATNEKKETALHLAIEQNHLHIANYLLSSEPTLFTLPNHLGYTPIQMVANTGDLNKLAWLYKKGKLIPGFEDNLSAFNDLYNVATLDAKIFLAKKNLLDAVKAGNTYWVNHALLYQPRLSAKDKHGNTALHLAVRGQHNDIVELLLSAGANPTIDNAPYDTPFSPIENQSQTVLDLAKAMNSALIPLIATHFLFHAAHSHNTDHLHIALTSGANLLGTDREGRTALHFAVLSENKMAVKFLLRHHITSNIDIHIADKFGKTPHYLADELNTIVETKVGKKKMADYLLEKMAAYKAERKEKKQHTILSTSSFGLLQANLPRVNAVESEHSCAVKIQIA